MRQVNAVVALALLAACARAQMPVTLGSIRGYMQKNPSTGLFDASQGLQPFCYVSRQQPFKVLYA